MADTSKDSLKDAFAAILKGDYAERDRLLKKCELQIQMEDKSYRVAKVLEVDFYVNSVGTTYITKQMYAVSN